MFFLWVRSCWKFLGLSNSIDEFTLMEFQPGRFGRFLDEDAAEAPIDPVKIHLSLDTRVSHNHLRDLQRKALVCFHEDRNRRNHVGL